MNLSCVDKPRLASQRQSLTLEHSPLLASSLPSYQLPNFKRDDFSEDALIARDEIDDDALISRMVEIMDSRSYEEMTPIERRAIINGVDRTDKKPSFASKLLTKLIYRLAGKKN